jgi:hypothetical protein
MPVVGKSDNRARKAPPAFHFQLSTFNFSVLMGAARGLTFAKNADAIGGG